MDFDFDFSRDEKRKKRKKIIKKFTILFAEIAAVIVLAYLLTEYAIERTTMPGDSMNITLNNEDVIIVDKLTYLFSDPKRYDVVVFNLYGKEHDYYSVKRIIGLPGEKIHIKGGIIYVDDVMLDEPMEVDKMLIPGLAKEPIYLDEDEYFVLGDNRNYSEDSRFANIGNIVKSDIVGRCFIRTNDFNFIGKINMNKKKTKENEENIGE